MKREVLVIDKSTAVYETIQRNFESETIKVSHAKTPDEGLIYMHHRNFSLIVIDLMLSESTGHEVITALREMQPMPILVLSENTSTMDQVQVLKNGADDYLEKPCDLEICLAKAQALLRRYTELNHIAGRGYAVVCHENLLLDTARRIVSFNGNEIALSRKEYEILLYLMRNKNRVLTYEQIYEAVWKDTYLNDNATIFYQIGQLRRKLGDAGLIESVHGVGYRLKN